jgi:hypothetical protein
MSRHNPKREKTFIDPVVLEVIVLLVTILGVPAALASLPTLAKGMVWPLDRSETRGRWRTLRSRGGRYMHPAAMYTGDRLAVQGRYLPHWRTGTTAVQRCPRRTAALG